MDRSSKIRRHATFANVTATLALFIAIGGGSFAVAGLSAPEKKVIKRIANKQITKRAPDLSVRHAESADTARNAEHADSADTATSFVAVPCEPLVPGTGEMLTVGSFCVDRYEASIWTQPDGGAQLASEAEIDAACPNSGQPTAAAPCTAFFARSVPGVKPARRATWFQAQQALANSGKRLPTNAEWQQAVSGTPDPGDTQVCNVNTANVTVANTGSFAGCVSRFGAFDMVGNLYEWVADWDEQADNAENCASWPVELGEDDLCIGDGGASRFPGALIRGGDVRHVGNTGPFAVGSTEPYSTVYASVPLGFRGAR